MVTDDLASADGREFTNDVATELAERAFSSDSQ